MQTLTASATLNCMTIDQRVLRWGWPHMNHQFGQYVHYSIIHEKKGQVLAKRRRYKNTAESTVPPKSFLCREVHHINFNNTPSMQNGSNCVSHFPTISTFITHSIETNISLVRNLSKLIEMCSVYRTFIAKIYQVMTLNLIENSGFTENLHHIDEYRKNFWRNFDMKNREKTRCFRYVWVSSTVHSKSVDLTSIHLKMFSKITWLHTKYQEAKITQSLALSIRQRCTHRTNKLNKVIFKRQWRCSCRAQHSERQSFQRFRCEKTYAKRWKKQRIVRLNPHCKYGWNFQCARFFGFFLVCFVAGACISRRKMCVYICICSNSTVFSNFMSVNMRA